MTVKIVLEEEEKEEKREGNLLECENTFDWAGGRSEMCGGRGTRAD